MELVSTTEGKDIEEGVKSGIKLEWKEVLYSVSQKDKPSEDKTILHSLSGEALPGEILGIMGTSGAGKSTLLDVLAGRIESHNLKGNILTNGSPVNMKSFRKSSGYVMQSDALYPLLTVRETFQYAAYLRIPDKSAKEKEQAAEEMIDLLRLETAANTIVGDDINRGLSGGEKRRVSIGVDIVHRPAVIFLDEPTSGLDSTTALSVIESLKRICDTNNSTVVMTIHQPSARLFNMLDKIMFLSGGRITYFGPVKDLIPYARKVYADAGKGEIPIENPPELFLDLCDDLKAKNQMELVLSNNTTMSPSSTKEIAELSLLPNDAASNPSYHYANSFFGDLWYLCSRNFKNTQRTPELFFARLGACIFFGVLMGTLFLNTGVNQAGIQLRLSYFVFTLAFFYYTSLEALPLFLQECEIFQREFSRGAYRAISYTLASTLVQLPFMLVLAIVYSSVSWFLVNAGDDASKFFFFIFCVFTTLVAGSCFAIMISTVVPSPMVGQTAGSGLFSVMFLFSGFFITTNQIPDYWIWLHYLSLFTYSYNSILASSLAGLSYGDVTNEQILSQFSVDGVNKGTGVGVLWLFIIVFRLFFYYRITTAFNGSRK